MLANISQLRFKFQQLIQENKQLPKEYQLSLHNYSFHQQFQQDINNDLQIQINQLNKKYAWIDEKYTLELQKIQSVYIDYLEMEYIQLKCFKSDVYAISYRVNKLSDQFKQELNDLIQKYTLSTSLSLVDDVDDIDNNEQQQPDDDDDQIHQSKAINDDEEKKKKKKKKIKIFIKLLNYVLKLKNNDKYK